MALYIDMPHFIIAQPLLTRDTPESTSGWRRPLHCARCSSILPVLTQDISTLHQGSHPMHHPAGDAGKCSISRGSLREIRCVWSERLWTPPSLPRSWPAWTVNSLGLIAFFTMYSVFNTLFDTLLKWVVFQQQHVSGRWKAATQQQTGICLDFCMGRRCRVSVGMSLGWLQIKLCFYW